MAASSLKLIGAPVTYTISDLAAISQQIPIPATAAGNTLLAFIASNETTAANNVTSVTDSASNTWSQRGSTQSSGTGSGHVATQVFACTGGTSASATWIKITPNANLKTVAVTFVELAGAIASPVDVNNGGTATAVTSVTASNTPVTANDIVFYFAAAGNQTLSHVADDKQVLAVVGGPYSAGTAGAGIMSSLVAQIGTPALPMTTIWTAGSSSNFAWSSVSLKASTPGTGPMYQVFQGTPTSAQDVNQIINTLQGAGSGPIYVANRIQAGLTGATAQNGYCGATASGPPASGSFLVGDWVIDQSGPFIQICTTAGSPGTWTRLGRGGYVARYHLGSAQNFTVPISDPTATLIDTLDFDPKTMWNAGSHGFVIPFSGARWRVISGQQFSLSGAGRVHVSITKNGTETSRGYTGPVINNLAGGMVSDIIPASSGDVIRAAFYSTVTGSVTLGGANSFLCIALEDG